MDDSIGDSNRSPQRDESGRHAGQQVGAYRLVKLLAEGGMGSVWVAELSDADELVALKFISASIAKRDASVLKRFDRVIDFAEFQKPEAANE